MPQATPGQHQAAQLQGSSVPGMSAVAVSRRELRAGPGQDGTESVSPDTTGRRSWRKLCPLTFEHVDSFLETHGRNGGREALLALTDLFLSSEDGRRNKRASSQGRLWNRAFFPEESGSVTC